MKNKLMRSDWGFTLVELMTVMAIIGILATAIMVSLSSHKKRAEGAKILSELSAVMQNVYLCIADEGKVSDPSGNGGGTICRFSSGPDTNYGKWPTLVTGYTYGGGNFAIQPWVYSATNSTDVVTICCNSTSGKCAKFDGTHICKADESL